MVPTAQEIPAPGEEVDAGPEVDAEPEIEHEAPREDAVPRAEATQEIRTGDATQELAAAGAGDSAQPDSPAAAGAARTGSEAPTGAVRRTSAKGRTIPRPPAQESTVEAGDGDWRDAG